MTIPHTMQAAFIRGPGGVDKIEYSELPVPQPGPTDVLVQMQASGVNHVDLFVRCSSWMFESPFPGI